VKVADFIINCSNPVNSIRYFYGVKVVFHFSANQQMGISHETLYLININILSFTSSFSFSVLFMIVSFCLLIDNGDFITFFVK